MNSMFFFRKILFHSGKMVQKLMKKKKELPQKKSTNEIILIEENNDQLQLLDVFCCPLKYHYIINLLADQKMISRETAKWIDFRKRNKEIMISLLKYLQTQGYYHLKFQISSRQIQAICANTFGVDISISWIKHIAAEESYFKFIEPAIMVKAS